MKRIAARVEEEDDLGPVEFSSGDPIIFKPGTGRKPWRPGWFAHYVEAHPGVIAVRLDGDVFDVCVPATSVIMNNDIEIPREDETMTTATATTAKELRRQAKALQIEGWEELSREDLAKAVATAEKAANGGSKKRTRPTAVEDAAPAKTRRTRPVETPPEEAPAARKTKKAAAAPEKAAPAKKKAPAAAEAAVEVAENGNPFNKGTNLYFITEEAIRGGKRSSMVKRLKNKIELHPRNPDDDFDEDKEIDRRIQMTAQLLANQHGFTYEKEGRGPDAHLKVTKG